MSAYLFIMSIILLSMMVATAISFRSLATPSFIWLFMWTFSFTVTAIFGSVYNIDERPLIIAFLSICAFWLGAFIASKGKPRTRNNLADLNFIVTNVLLIQAALLAIGFIGAVSQSLHFGGGLLRASSLQQAAAAASDTAASIYRGEQATPLIGRIGFAALQVGAAVTGLSLAIKHKHAVASRLLGLGFLFIAVMYTSISTTRGFTVIPILWCGCCYIASKVFYNRERDLSSPRFILSGAGIFFSLVFFVLGMQVARSGEFRPSQFSAAAEHMRPWVAGSIPSLSGNYSAWDREISAGAEFFGAIGKLANVESSTTRGAKTTGSDMVPIGAGARANAPTIFIALIRSFGDYGCVIASLIVGALSGFTYLQLRHQSSLAWAIYSSILAFVIWSPNVWFFGYGSRALTLVGLLALVALARWANSKGFSRVRLSGRQTKPRLQPKF